MKRTLLLLLAILIILPGKITAERKKVGVVLSGGGAKGVAHITALRVIEEAGIPIDFIAGTSMGAIVGGLYAIGYDTHTLDSLVRTQDWTTLLSDRVPRRNLSFGAREASDKYMITVPLSFDRGFKLPSGLVSGYNVYNLLYELTIGYHDSIPFNTLPIPFACMAYDMVTGKPVVMDHGYLPEAIRASMSIPGAFEPVDLGGMLLIDGGVYNNFPADVVKAMGADIIIGIDVGSGLKTKDQLKSVTDLVDQLTSFIGIDQLEANKKLIDVYIHPDIKPYNAGSFTPKAIDTLLRRGELAAYSKWYDLVELKKEIGIPDDYEPQRPSTVSLEKNIPVMGIHFEGLASESETSLRRVTGLKENTTITNEELQKAVSCLQGTNTLTDVHYRLDGHLPYELTFIVKERPRNSVSIGFRFDTEEMAAILLNICLSGKKMGNSHIDLTGRLGNNPYAQLSYKLGNETERQFTILYMYQYNDLNQYFKGKKISNLDFGHHNADIHFANIKVRNFMIGLGIKWDYYHFRSLLLSASTISEIRSQGLLSYNAGALFETLDSRNYPTRGQSLQVDYSLYTSNFVTYKGDAPYSAIQGNFIAAASINKRVIFIPGIFTRILIGNNIAYPSMNFMGGTNPGRYMPQQIPFIGIHHFEAFDKSIVGVRFNVQARVGKRQYVMVKTNYAVHNNDFFNLFDGESLFGAGIGYSYNSIVGPIDLMVDYSTRDKKLGLYFNLGHFF